MSTIAAEVPVVDDSLLPGSDMPFPDSERVIYDRNPLDEVICQLRFPPLLRIEAEVPAAFQEAIRRVYPILSEVRQAEFPLGLPPELAELVGKALGQRTSYQFATTDKNWEVALTRDFLAITARAYVRWEDFKDHLRPALHALVQVYAPAPFSRVGLRYRDVICPGGLGLEGVPWAQLLMPHIAAELTDEHVSKQISEAKREVLIAIPNGSVRIRHGLAVKEGANELCYVVDSDFFLEQPTEATDAIEVLDGFNRRAGRLFRWSITDRLHEALGPRPAG